ncbi:hypothetical protein [Rubrivirga marina]|uniref:Helicase HerA barrel domain-containing protein n=1 Tax=Rubrivirga marina TaxID=1196024 RepID=A0A271J1C0_9BACT|nr:hypothetical protein [Rubrivirga marina]PAP77306.1 hypothetical protein BSZ37_13105 [Rubrivirga marina]
MSVPVAEVIASSTREIVAEVYAEAETPAFGSWVEIETDDGTVLYGLVSHAETGSVEPGRQAVALGADYDRDRIRREMPQILELVRTTVRAQVLAYWDGQARVDGRPHVRQTLPPRPAALHDRVRPCGPDAVAALAAPFDVLRTLARHPDPAVPADDLLAAVLRNLHAAHGGGDDGETILVEAGRALARLLDDDHERLQSILRRVR